MIGFVQTIFGLLLGAIAVVATVRWARLGVVARAQANVTASVPVPDGTKITAGEAELAMRQLSTHAFMRAPYFIVGGFLVVSTTLFGELSAVTGLALLLVGVVGLTLGPRLAFAARMPTGSILLGVLLILLGLILIIDVASPLYAVTNRILAVIGAIGFLRSFAIIVDERGAIGMSFGDVTLGPEQRKISGWFLLIPAVILWICTGSPGSIFGPFVELARWLF